MKKVIFVGSAPYSGSTLFGMTLANDPRGFACGEVYHLFHPSKPHHLTPTCGCGDPHCDIWQTVKKNGEDALFDTLFERFPKVEFIVTSYKSPYWIQEQNSLMSRRGIETKNILIWKTPYEFAESCNKRGMLDHWEKAWTNYHRLYHTLIENWAAVKFDRYTSDTTLLRHICSRLEIPYFEGKEQYWNKTHHILFGNHSARIHLYNTSSKSYEQAQSTIKADTNEHADRAYRTIYNPSDASSSIRRQVEKQVRASRYIDDILRLLESHDVAANTALPPSPQDAIRLSHLRVQIGRMKQDWETKTASRRILKDAQA